MHVKLLNIMALLKRRIITTNIITITLLLSPFLPGWSDIHTVSVVSVVS